MNIRNNDTRDDAVHDDDRAFDHAMRQLHAQALEQVSPAVRARLRAARRATPTAPARRGIGWVLASGFAAVSALAIGLQLQKPATPVVPASTPTVAAVSPAAAFDAETAIAALDENPDLYLWLASNDDDLPLSQQ